MTKKKASVTMPTCPHCQQAAGCLKQRGAYHEVEHQGELIKLFHVRCKACEGSFTLREVWPQGADSGAIPSV